MLLYKSKRFQKFVHYWRAPGTSNRKNGHYFRHICLFIKNHKSISKIELHNSLENFVRSFFKFPASKSVKICSLYIILNKKKVTFSHYLTSLVITRPRIPFGIEQVSRREIWNIRASSHFLPFFFFVVNFNSDGAQLRERYITFFRVITYLITV